MSQSSETDGYVIPSRAWSWLGTRRAISVLLWLAAFAAAGHFLHHSWTWFENLPGDPEERIRADRNGGHAQIDFGGQWLMGRMVVLGHARELYHRQRQWEVVRASFPVEDEAPGTQLGLNRSVAVRLFGGVERDFSHDADNLMYWCMGEDPKEWKQVGGAAVAPLGIDPFGNPLLAAAQVLASAKEITPEVLDVVSKPAVGGPLYPPVHAFLYAPLGMIERPHVAYRVMQVFCTLVVFLAGFGVKVLSEGRIPWSLATLTLFLFPGTRAGLDLGQNPMVSLAIAVWGWALLVRGYTVAGGMVWGLCAFKPIWGLAFFLVPVLTRRWRFCAAMVLTGCGLAAATLPFVGVQVWRDWLTVGKEAAALYNVNKNWINLSRDVQGIPRRILHDFSLPQDERDTVLAMSLAWTLWGLILGTTATIYLRYGDRNCKTGVGIAFLFFGAYLTCYRFMYYDALLGAMGCAVLFANPARCLRTRVFGLNLVPQPTPLPADRELSVPQPPTPSFLGPRLLGCLNSFPLTIFVCLLLYENTFSGLDIRGTFGIGYFGHVATSSGGATVLASPQVQFDSGINYPWETAMVFLLWAWCGWTLARGEERRVGATAPS